MNNSESNQKFKTGDPIESSRFANYVASFTVEEKGTAGISDFNRLIKRASLMEINL